MVTTVHNSLIEQTMNTLAFTNPDRHNKPTIDSDFSNPQLKVSQLLQTTLELEQLLQIFFNEMHSMLGINSLGYRNEKINCSLDFGRSAKHSCNYSLKINNSVLGDLILTRSKRFNEQDLQLLESMMGSLVCPIRNALLYKEALQAALKDPLTGIGNRSALETTLEREVSLAHRHQQPFSLLMLDIDFFKNIDDTYGHAAGDKVLINIAQQLIMCCRETDICYRYGGEEFAIILNQTDQLGARLTAERLRHHIERITTVFQNNGLKITCSIGAASLQDDEKHSDLFIRADKALYRAKNNGRNQVAYTSD